MRRDDRIARPCFVVHTTHERLPPDRCNVPFPIPGSEAQPFRSCRRVGDLIASMVCSFFSLAVLSAHDLGTLPLYYPSAIFDHFINSFLPSELLPRAVHDLSYFGELEHKDAIERRRGSRSTSCVNMNFVIRFSIVVSSERNRAWTWWSVYQSSKWPPKSKSSSSIMYIHVLWICIPKSPSSGNNSNKFHHNLIDSVVHIRAFASAK